MCGANGTAHKMMDQDKKDYDELKEQFTAQAQEIERWEAYEQELIDRAEVAEARVREQAQEIERLTREVAWIEPFKLSAKNNASFYDQMKERAEVAEARVQEIDGILDVLGIRDAEYDSVCYVKGLVDRIEQIHSEIAEREAATIERCAELADRIDTVNGIGDAIRALKDPTAAPPEPSESGFR
jgi:chromosome segregation ATPase